MAAPPVKLPLVNIKHCDCLSWFSAKCESHKQDGETLSAQQRCNAATASGDPAMAFGPSSDMNGQRPILRVGSSAAISRWQLKLPGNSGADLARRLQTRGTSRAQTFSGEYPAARSAPCNDHHSCAADNRESAAVATPA